MRMRDLADEMRAAARRLRQPQIDRLFALGVTGATLARIWFDVPPIGIAPARGESDGLYSPDQGPLHVIQPLHSGGVLVDLVAWRSDAPTRTWLRTGAGWALGEHELCDFSACTGAPLLHASPLDWLRAGGRGAVILDWTAPEIARLRNHGRIRCRSRALAAMLRDAIAATVRMPDIIEEENDDATQLS